MIRLRIFKGDLKDKSVVLATYRDGIKELADEVVLVMKHKLPRTDAPKKDEVLEIALTPEGDDLIMVSGVASPENLAKFHAMRELLR